MSSLGILLLCLASAVGSFWWSTCHAASPETEYQKIQTEIKKQKKQIERIKKQESSILSDIEETTKQIKKIESELDRYRTRLRNTEQRIARVTNEIARSQSEIERYRLWIRRKLRSLYRAGHEYDLVMLMLGSADLSQLIRANKNLQFIAAHEHRQMMSYRTNLERLRVQEEELSRLKRQLIADRAKVLAEETSLTKKKKDKEAILAAVKEEKTSRLKLLREMEEASRRLLDIIRESERGERVPGKGFAALKGKLPWPVEGSVVIPYGSQRDPEFNTPVFRSGTFIESRADSTARAVHDGVVVFAEWFKGYGQLVIINHGDGYHSLYGSLSEIFARVGDIIKSKQAIGRTGMSGLINLPGLYFELRYRGKPLNPLQWLQRR